MSRVHRVLYWILSRSFSTNFHLHWWTQVEWKTLLYLSIERRPPVDTKVKCNIVFYIEMHRQTTHHQHLLFANTSSDFQSIIVLCFSFSNWGFSWPMKNWYKNEHFVIWFDTFWIVWLDRWGIVAKFRFFSTFSTENYYLFDLSCATLKF